MEKSAPATERGTARAESRPRGGGPLVNSRLQSALQRIALSLLVFLVGLAGTSVPPVLAQQAPLAGTGPSGAGGPFTVIVKDLPAPSSSRPRILPPEPKSHGLGPAPSAPIEVQAEDANITESGVGALATTSGAATTLSSFTIPGTVDVSGATNGNVIVTPDGVGNLDIYGLSGNLAKSTSESSFWCGGTNPPPICTCTGPNPAPPPICNPPCSGVGFDGDDRVAYDTASSHFIISALWIFGCNTTGSGSSKKVWAQDVMAISQTSDPTGAWNRYEFPSCGAQDSQDPSDQPHLGFNNQWVVVNSACAFGPGLAVFDKNNLYADGTLSLNSNWFEFTDAFNRDASDNPVLTYAPTIQNREYFTHAARSSSGYATITYSHLQGATDSPVFFQPTETVTTNFAVASSIVLPAVSAPGCTRCMYSLSNSWFHSGGVWSFLDGVAYIVSTVVMGDPKFSNSTQIINWATNTSTGAGRALRLEGGENGSGPMAAEIAMPLVLPSGAPDEALVVYDHSRPDFFPGVKSVLWNIDANSVTYNSVLQEGSLTPNNGDQNRWVDFISSITPIPGTSSLVAGATVASPSSSDSQRATYWTELTP